MTVPFPLSFSTSDVQTQVKRNTAIASKLRPPVYAYLFQAPVFDFSDQLSRYGHHSTIIRPSLTRTVTGSMYFIDINAFLRREWMICSGKRMDHRTNIFDFRDDETTSYAILSHRWIDEVNYEEMVDLHRMERQEQDEIRGCLGYKKILDTCKQAKHDGYEWVWVDTCCIDKRSSGVLSEAINAMYRWYRNSRICYVYLHDVLDASFPTKRDHEKYPKSNGWPEWFSRGWTLQEMIAPMNVQFFNRDWLAIGDKTTLACTLTCITGVPEHILKDGLWAGNRPCSAQIMSWAANRTTTRIEDRAYSLMGLLDVNMLALYGEGRKAFHRLQMEIIRSSDDQSIFAWGWHGENTRTGSILADDPSFFEHCSEMELMGYDPFIESLKKSFPKKEFPPIDKDHLGVSTITNRGIQIWMFLRPYAGSETVFKAWLPCRNYSKGPPVTINMAVRNYNYLRYFLPLEELPTGQVYSFAKCISDITRMRFAVSPSTLTTRLSLRMDSLTVTRIHQIQETQSSSLAPVPFVLKAMLKRRATVAFQWPLDNSLVWTGYI